MMPIPFDRDTWAPSRQCYVALVVDTACGPTIVGRACGVPRPGASAGAASPKPAAGVPLWRACAGRTAGRKRGARGGTDLVQGRVDEEGFRRAHDDEGGDIIMESVGRLVRWHMSRPDARCGVRRKHAMLAPVMLAMPVPGPHHVAAKSLVAFCVASSWTGSLRGDGCSPLAMTSLGRGAVPPHLGPGGGAEPGLGRRVLGLPVAVYLGPGGRDRGAEATLVAARSRVHIRWVGARSDSVLRLGSGCV